MSRRSKKTGYPDHSAFSRSETSNLFPWSEWTDIELNAEQWDYPKGGPFTDPQQITMPRSLRTIIEWKRFGELNSVVAPVLYEATLSYPNFTTNNHHLMHSEFIRCFVSTIVNLQYCGRNGLEVENPTSNFSWSMSEQQWQGWFNVYSLNKAGKGISHRPVFNPNGKYVVRIFHMGRWRRIPVDDSVPVDETGTPLLPRTPNVNELWPIILAKALLKIAALSWTENREIVDCSLITCVTGWICLSLDVSRLSSLDKWELVTKYAKRFEWPREENPPTDQSKFGLLDKSRSRKSKTVLSRLVEVPEDSQPSLLFFSLEDARNADGQEIPGITPCWSHQIYVDMFRDIPLDPTQARAPLAKWKNHRWLDWAMRQGLVDASDYFVPLRCLLVVSPLARCTTINTEREIDEDFVEKQSEVAPVSRSLTTIDEKGASIADVTLKASWIDEPQKQDTSVWADFNKLSRYLREIHLFYRRKFFEYSDEIGQSATQPSIDKVKRTDSSTKDAKKIAIGSRETSEIEERATHEYQEPMWRSRNEQLYLFVDSVDEKFFLVNFSTAPWKYNNDDDETSAVGSSSVVFERHDIFDERYYGYDCIGSIRTRGAKSIVFQLEPGRHLLRVLTNFATNAMAVILSDTAFKIGDLSSMHELMMVEATRIEEVARRIGDSVIGAFEAFGTSDYAIQLKNYYRSYAPDTPREMCTPTMEQRSHRRLLKSVHECFIEEFFKFAEKRFPPIDLPNVRRSMRVFFVDPSIGATLPSTFRDEDEHGDGRIDEEESKMARYATIVQSFFRMVLIKRYRAIHDIKHPEHSRVKETLLRIAQVFRTEHGPHCVLREIVERHQASEKLLYSWLMDLRHVIVIQELRGRSNDLTEMNDQWIPVVRINVNVAKNVRVLAAIDLFTNLSRCAVRSFDNDALCEMPRVVNNVTPNCYTYRENGYTIFAYGWMSDEARKKGVEWSLRLTTIKGQPTFHTINRMFIFPAAIDMPPLEIRDASNVYLPNPRGCLFRLIARVRSRTLVSLRLNTSYDRVLARLRIAREDGSIVAEIEGGGNLIVPLVFLEYEAPNELSELSGISNEPRKSSSRKHRGSLSDRSGILTRRGSTEGETLAKPATRYTIEAFVREDSWPLTEAEWIALTEFTSSEDVGKNRATTKTSEGRRSQRSRHLSKKPLMEFVREPHWSLRIVTDPGSEMDVVPDTSRDERIAELRQLWNAQESGRSERGKKLRHAFLEEISRMVAPSLVTDLTSAATASSTTEMDETIGSTDSTAHEIKKFSSTRTLEPPAHLSGYLPKLDLTIYMVKEDEEEDRWVKTEFDEETLRNQRAINVLDYEQHRLSFLEESSRMIEARREKYRRAAQRYAENRENRNRELNEVYETRQAYVESTKRTSGSVKSKAGSKHKKGR